MTATGLDDRREAIASLTGNRGYLLLLEDMDDSVNSILSDLAEAKSDVQILRLGRLFQFAYRFHSLLKTHPENLKAEIELDMRGLHESEVQELDENAPPFPPTRQVLLRQIESMTREDS